MTFFGFESNRNDYLGEGRRKLFTDADGVFTVSHDPGRVAIDFLGPQSEQGTEYWSMRFEAPRLLRRIAEALDRHGVS